MTDDAEPGKPEKDEQVRPSTEVSEESEAAGAPEASAPGDDSAAAEVSDPAAPVGSTESTQEPDERDEAGEQGEADEHQEGDERDDADEHGEHETADERQDAEEQGDREEADESEGSDKSEEPGEPESTDGLAVRVPWASMDNRRFTGVAVVLTLVQLALLGQLLARQYFLQDDYALESSAATQGFGWQYLVTPHGGHLMPGGLAVAWVVTRISPLNWPLAAVTILIFQALASFSVIRVLRMLFGSRPAVLLLFALFLFGTLNMPVAGWWAAALEVLPFEAMMALALGWHVTYLREGGRRPALMTLLFVALGLVFMAKAIVVPPLLFLITAGYFTRKATVGASVLEAARRHWAVWSVYVAVLIGYEIFYRHRLDLVHETAHIPDSISAIWGFSEQLVFHTLIPGLFGGPWKWTVASAGSWAFAGPPSGLVYLSWLALAAVIGASVAFRARAGRAWLILAAYVVGADIIPVLAGRVSVTATSIAQLLGTETRYVADALVVVAVCLGFAFLPMVGETDPYRRSLSVGPRFSGLAQSFGGAVAVVAAVGLVVSVVSYHRDVDGDANRSWVAHARAALKSGIAASSIVDTQVPESMVLRWGGDDSLMSHVLAPVATKKQLGDLTMSQPIGPGVPALAFDDKGFLRPIVGLTTGGPDQGAVAPAGPVKGAGYCFGGPDKNNARTVDIPLSAVLGWHVWTVRISYLDHDATSVHVKFGAATRTLQLPAGVGTATITLAGNSGVVELSGVTSAGALCIGGLDVGYPVFQ